MASTAGAAPFVPASPRSRSLAPVRLWLFVLAGLVVAMVAVGGATRLTGSGLSITEWRPVTGALPPLSEAQWAAEFGRYRASPQYELLNKGMTLPEFKFIYAWEWGHRQLGRLLGLAFFVPLVVFAVRGMISRRLALSLAAVGALGGLQGAVGWIMVRSGLEPGMIAVAPVKLTLHLTLASLILASLVWLAAGTIEAREGRGGGVVAPRLLALLVLLQIALGGLVAGSKAGLVYNTWPLMDGMLVPPPSDLFVVRPRIENFVDNAVLVQFNHRLVGTALVLFALWQAFSLSRRFSGSAAARRAQALAGLCVVQMGLGIVTLVLAVPLWAGLAHQVFAMAVLGLAVAHARLSGKDSGAAEIPARISRTQ